MLHAFLAQSILHALVAMLVTEGLLRAWRVEEARWRLRLHAMPLLVAVLLVPALFLVAPSRLQPAFAESVALFAGSRWDLLALGGVPLGRLALLLACGVGSALFLRDALPPLVDLLRPARRQARGPSLPVPAGVADAVGLYARHFGIDPPHVAVIGNRRPVLLCEGWPPRLVVSAGTLEGLTPAALDTALAHELAHVARRDPAIGYGLILLRGLMFYNPAVQWAARAMVDDLEWRADQDAMAATGRPVALADAIMALFHAGSPPPGDGSPSFEWSFWRIRRAGMARRSARLRRDPFPLPMTHGRLRLALAWVGVVVLAWFIV